MVNDVILGTQTKIFLEAVGAAGSTFGTGISAEIKSMPSLSGGDKDVDYEPLFDGGNIEMIKPNKPFEIDLDVAVYYDGTDFDALVNGSTKMQFAWYATDGTLHYWEAYNNAIIKGFEKKHEAEGKVEGTLKLSVAYSTANGVSNRKKGLTDYADAGTGITWE